MNSKKTPSRLQALAVSRAQRPADNMVAVMVAAHPHPAGLSSTSSAAASPSDLEMLPCEDGGGMQLACVGQQGRRENGNTPDMDCDDSLIPAIQPTLLDLGNFKVPDLLQAMGPRLSMTSSPPEGHVNETLVITSGPYQVNLQLPPWELVLQTDFGPVTLTGPTVPAQPMQLIQAPDLGALPAYPYADPDTLAELEARLAAMWDIQKGFAEHLSKHIDGMRDNVTQGFRAQEQNVHTIYNLALENAKALQSLTEHVRGLSPQLAAKIDVQKGFETLYGFTAAAMTKAETQFQQMQTLMSNHMPSAPLLRKCIVDELNSSLGEEFMKFLGPRLKDQLMEDLKLPLLQETYHKVQEDIRGTLLEEMKGKLTHALKASLAGSIDELKSHVTREVDSKLHGTLQKIHADLKDTLATDTANLKSALEQHVAAIQPATFDVQGMQALKADVAALESKLGDMDESLTVLLDELLSKVDKVEHDMNEWDAWGMGSGEEGSELPPVHPVWEESVTTASLTTPVSPLLPLMHPLCPTCLKVQ